MMKLSVAAVTLTLLSLCRAAPKYYDPGMSNLRACLWQCGQCFMDSDELLMTCANDLCIQQSNFVNELMDAKRLFDKCPMLSKALGGVQRVEMNYKSMPLARADQGTQ